MVQYRRLKDGSAVSELMDVFTKDGVYNPKFPETSSWKKHYKETERGIEIMCDIVQKIADDERAEGRKDAIFVLNKLNDSGRTEVVQRALKDQDYLNQLIAEFRRS